MRKRNCRVQVRLDNKEYQGFMKAVFPDKRADGGCGKAAGEIRAHPPWKGGEAHGQGH